VWIYHFDALPSVAPELRKKKHRSNVRPRAKVNLLTLTRNREKADVAQPIPNYRYVPKIASNYSTINGGYGAIAAVSETQDDIGFVPNIDTHARSRPYL
jgi:hypothetical protein